MCRGMWMTVTPSLGTIPDSGSAKHNQLAAAGPYFLEVGFQLLEQVVVGRHRDDRHIGIHQRQRPVLELARGVALGMDVGDFPSASERLPGRWDTGAPRPRNSAWCFIRKALRQLVDRGDRAPGSSRSVPAASISRVTRLRSALGVRTVYGGRGRSRALIERRVGW